MDNRPPSRRDRAIWRRLWGLAASIPLPVGQFFIGAGAPFAAGALILTSRSPYPVWARRVLLLSIISLLGVGLSALWTGVSPTREILLSLVAVTMYLAALPRLLRSQSDAAQFIWWLSLSAIVAYLALGTTHEATGLTPWQERWKYGLALPVALIVVATVVRKNRPHVFSATVLLLLGVLGLSMNFRAQAVICAGAAMLVLAKGRKQNRAAFRVGLAASLAAIGIAGFAPGLISSGIFGQNVAMRTIEQDGDGGNLLLGGRVEPPLSIAAISARPLLGWGNAQQIDSETLNRGSEIAQAAGMRSTAAYLPLWIRPDGRISLHSIILGGWAENGLLAAVMPIGLLTLFVQAALRARGRVYPLVAVCAVWGAWDLLFSPWADSRGIFMAAFAVLAAWSIPKSGPQEADELGTKASSKVGVVHRRERGGVDF